MKMVWDLVVWPMAAMSRTMDLRRADGKKFDQNFARSTYSYIVPLTQGVRLRHA